MTHQVTCFSDAYAAWEHWDSTSFDYKSERLLSIIGNMDKDMSHLSMVVSYHLAHAKSLLSNVKSLVGPTGETNELYTSGRGVALIIQDDKTTQAQQAVLALVSAATIAGNSVIVCSDDTEFTKQLSQAFVSLPTGLVQCVSFDAYHQLLESDVRSVGYVGNTAVEQSINRQLANRNGCIVGLVSSVDSNRALALDTHLCLRFITEKTRTINVTAVGGNATLLELGSESH
ncbi:1-pyrroline-5-carboxylate dehydrogenase [Vibrio sp. S4M6]|uniref:1-pyrroline-5-carboxylate dehydrogenase n=1 Tax=Vibrio sinus TaxID=2946865 RepID=UPI00202A9294|nr:1-pyrroline-5-carboxylate dehydrogenase [Vibrio sinus]MCL9781702.1 1-pyrroline-5-carboxylate dehydrogenase [Vibrio sinus]